MAQAVKGEASRYDVDVRMAGGRLMTIDFMIAPLRNTEGEITHLLPSAVDITERKAAENALRASEARLKLAQDAGGGSASGTGTCAPTGSAGRIRTSAS